MQVHCSFHQIPSKHGTAHPCRIQNVWVLFNTTLNKKSSYREQKEEFPVFRCQLLQSPCCKVVSVLPKPKHSSQAAGVLSHDFGITFLLAFERWGMTETFVSGSPVDWNISFWKKMDEIHRL